MGTTPVSDIAKFGRKGTSCSTLTIPVSTIFSPLVTTTDTGTSCRLSSIFRAVTTSSSSAGFAGCSCARAGMPPVTSRPAATPPAMSTRVTVLHTVSLPPRISRMLIHPCRAVLPVAARWSRA